MVVPATPTLTAAAAAAAAAASADAKDIERRLGKRATFEAAAAELTTLLLCRARCRQVDPQHPAGPLDAELWHAVTRCFTLLQSRYTAPAFWRAGSMLFQAAIAAASDMQQHRKASDYLATTEKHLQDQDHGQQHALERSGTSGQPYFFEGQMSEGQEVAPRPWDIQDLLGMLLRGNPAEQQEQQAGDVEGEASEQGLRHQAVDQLFQHLQAAFGGENVEGLEEALRASLEDDTVAHGPPPASKSAVKALQKERVTVERLQELGGPQIECAVCREQLEAGEEVQVMPCHDHHVYHTQCLAPWLEQHNSCPVCRHELPTDDVHYERQKERNAIAAEERSGAANALSHAEFIYQ